MNITVFERSSYIGGRAATVDVFDDPAYPVELGASIFVKVNYNLVNASRDLGLMMQTAERHRAPDSSESIGIWDGDRFVCKFNGSGWWDIAKLLWRYGYSPIKTQNLMKRTVGKFLELYEEPMFPFKSLTAAVGKLGLFDSASTTGEKFLDKNSISSDFAREIIQASTRVNYGQNLGLIHGLGSMVCMATEGAMSVEGGNWRIFDGMLKASSATIQLNNTVTRVSSHKSNTYVVTSQPNDSVANKEDLVFDDVVLAAPLQYSDLTIHGPLKYYPPEIPYVTLHVTLFSSPHRLSHRFFNLDKSSDVPQTILTTLPLGTDLGSRKDGVGHPGFWSISVLRTVPAASGGSHYVYKIFSPERVSGAWIADILGLDVEIPPNASVDELPETDVSWSHEKVWNPYPFAYPRVTFEEPELAPGLWYTSGIEGFISTMETSALMGRNVAALMARSWEGNVAGEVEEEGDGESGARVRTEL